MIICILLLSTYCTAGKKFKSDCFDIKLIRIVQEDGHLFSNNTLDQMI